jgi:4-hydroxyacetophenone monooxygenase
MAQDFRIAVREAVRDEVALRTALAEADIAPMLMVLVQLTGDLAILEEVAPHIQGPWSFLQSVPEPLKQKLRDRLVVTLQDYAASGREAPPQPPEDVLQRMMSAGVGQPVPEEYIPLLLEEMRFGAEDTRAVRWRADPAKVPAQNFKVIIIGAGFGGLCAAIRLKQLGIPFEVLEKNADVGGTWLENVYPGCAVDTPNHFYSYSFHVNNRWTRHFSQRDEILAYIEDVTRTYDLRSHIRFGVEATSAVFDEKTERWQVTWRDGARREEHAECNAVISAVGQLNRPAIPKVAGLDDFKGPLFHTARWDSTIDLKGKRVAMIGTGASGMQAGPSIAPEVAHLRIFQRTPHWAMNNPNYHRAMSAGNSWALQNIPYFSNWLRFQLFWASSDGFHASLHVDPNWRSPEISLNDANHKMRELIVEYVRGELGGDEALLAKVIPTYPPYGKRMLRDNYWYRMLKRENVALETDPISHITADAIVMKDGTVHPVDVIILATGFQASRMLWPLDIRGRDGHSIRGDWGDDDPRGYLGITVPHYPNLFLVYGPNTNLAHGGSIIFHTECQVRYIVQALREMIERGYATMEVRQDVHDQYNHRLDEKAQSMVWAHPGVTSWYKNDRNRITVTSPWRLLDYWGMTRHFLPEDFQVAKPGGKPAVPGQQADAITSADSLAVS